MWAKLPAGNRRLEAKEGWNLQLVGLLRCKSRTGTASSQRASSAARPASAAAAGSAASGRLASRHRRSRRWTCVGHGSGAGSTS